MNLDECHSRLIQIRRQQATRHPKIRVDCGGSIFQGRLARADSDPEHRGMPLEAEGALVLEDVHRGRQARTVVQISRIPSGGIHPMDENS